LKSFDASEVTTVVLGQEVETLMVDELSHNLESDLITPSVDEWHGHIIEEDSHFLAAGRNEGTSLLSLNFTFN